MTFIPNGQYRLIALILPTLLAIITFPKAGMVKWVPPILSILLALSLFLYLRKKNYRLNTADYPWLFVWLSYSLIIILQLFVFPNFVVWNSPEHHIPNLDLSGRAINTPAIMQSWVLFCCYWSFAFLISKLKPSEIKLCLYVIAIIALFQSSYGVLADLVGQKTIIGIWTKEYYRNSATGSFVNYNHYANYIALALPLSIIFLVNQLIKAYRSKNSTTIIVLSTLLVSLIIFGVFALVASKSRMGSAIGGFGIILAFYFLLTSNIRLSRTFKIILICSIAYAGFMIANFIGLEPLIDRYERVLIYDARWSIWDSIFDIPFSVWIAGSGAGTFFDIFLQVHPTELPKTTYYAHNDYLQFAVEMGGIGIIVIGSAMIYWFIKTRTPSNIIQISCLISIALMAIHSLVDFSLHIPANALLFWFCVGCYANAKLSRYE